MFCRKANIILETNKEEIMALLIESQDQKTLKPFATLAKQMGLKVRYTSRIVINNRENPKSEFEKKIEAELLNYRSANREKTFQKSAMTFSKIRSRAETENWQDVSLKEVNAIIAEARAESKIPL